MTSIRDALATELAHVRQFTPEDGDRESDIEAALAALPDELPEVVVDPEADVIDTTASDAEPEPDVEPDEVETTAVEPPEAAVESSGKARKPTS